MIGCTKVTAKGQTTIPHEIRAALNLKPGDCLAWVVDSDTGVTVRRVQPLDMEYLRAAEAMLVEWAGAEDKETYRDL